MGSIADQADESAKRVLAIGAQAGDDGVKAYQAAQAQVGQIQQDALGRLGNDVSQINAPTGLRGELGTLITRPTTQLQQEMAAGQARHLSNVAKSGYDTLGYLNSLKGIEPMIDRLLAAQAGGGGGGGGSGGGGGGRGGGGGGKGDTLSDSELRKQLSGAAVQVRESNIGAAAENLKAAGATRKAATAVVKSKQQAMKKQVVKAQGGPLVKKQGGKGQVRQVVGLAQRYQNAPEGSKKQKRLGKKLMATPGSIIGGLRGAAAAVKPLGQARGLAQQAARGQRAAYGGLLQERNANLADIARQVGVDAGEDPNRVYGLIGPTEEKSFRLADEGRNKAEGGAINALGMPPTLGKFAAAADIKVTPQKAKVMRKSSNYLTLSTEARKAVAEGKTMEEFQREILQPWAQPFPLVHKSGKKQGEPVMKKGKQVMHPGYGNLVNLVMLDYAPAFLR